MTARLAPLLLCAAAAAATAQPATTPTRGALLYGAHCIACHTTQMHWREQRLATDWPALKALVRRWQAAASLNWSDDDIVDVARHLNDTIYGLPQTEDRRGALEAAPARLALQRAEPSR